MEGRGAVVELDTRRKGTRKGGSSKGGRIREREILIQCSQGFQ